MNNEGCSVEENDLWQCHLMPENRNFLMRKIGQIKLISELTQQWPDNKGGYKYIPVDSKTMTATRRIITSSSPISVLQAKDRYFERSNN